MTDQLQAFILNHKLYRGVLVRLNASYQKIIQLHNYPKSLSVYLGELLAAAALLGNNLKQKGRLALQIETEEYIKFLVAEINHQHGIRGLAQWRDDVLIQTNPLSQGKFVMTLMPEQGERYQGIVPLRQANIAKSLETYFSQSEQIFTRICLAADDQTAAGLLIQKLPQTESFDEPLDTDALQLIVDTVSTKELLHDESATLLRKLFHDFTIEAFPSESIHFECTCNHSKMINAVRLLGKKEAEEILSTHKTIDVTCEFCNDHYAFDQAEVEKLFS